MNNQLQEAEKWLMYSRNSVQKSQPHKTTFKCNRVNKVLIGELGITIHLIYGFWCTFALFTHASALNLVIFQRSTVTSFHNKPIKQQRCWHMRRDIKGRMGRSSAKLEGKRKREEGREPTHGHIDGWAQCGFTTLPIYTLLHPHPAEVGNSTCWQGSSRSHQPSEAGQVNRTKSKTKVSSSEPAAAAPVYISLSRFVWKHQVERTQKQIQGTQAGAEDKWTSNKARVPKSEVRESEIRNRLVEKLR